MATTESLGFIKSLSKKLARARRIKQFIALDVSAQQMGYPHWNALTAGYKKGWRPSSTQIDSLRELVNTVNPLRAEDSGAAALNALYPVPGITLATSNPRDVTDPLSADEIFGELDGHKFRLRVVFDDVFMEGRGWRLVVSEAPSASPEVSVTDRRIKSNPIENEAFVDKALRVAQIRAEQVRARIASDWPRRSTIPDANGKLEHPLFDETADRWACIHCDQVFSGKQIAENLWHCPDCSASPINIHSADEWINQRNDGDRQS